MNFEQRYALLMVTAAFLAGLLDGDGMIGDAFAGAILVAIVCVMAKWVVDGEL